MNQSSTHSRLCPLDRLGVGVSGPIRKMDEEYTVARKALTELKEAEE